MNHMAAPDAGVPQGFRLIAFEGVTFNSANGPFYIRREGEEIVMGFRVEQRHCNPAGILHGGMMMMVADMTAGFGTAIKSGIEKFMPTVNMTFDFVASGKVGDWVEGRCELLKVTRSLAFASVMLSTQDGPLLRASAVMKIPSGDGFRFDRARIIG
jgi:uncharacterized protein (TIGR00369 family)